MKSVQENVARIKKINTVQLLATMHAPSVFVGIVIAQKYKPLLIQPDNEFQQQWNDTLADLCRKEIMEYQKAMMVNPHQALEIARVMLTQRLEFKYVPWLVFYGFSEGEWLGVMNNYGIENEAAKQDVRNFIDDILFEELAELSREYELKHSVEDYEEIFSELREEWEDYTEDKHIAYGKETQARVNTFLNRLFRSITEYILAFRTLRFHNNEYCNLYLQFILNTIPAMDKKSSKLLATAWTESDTGEFEDE